MEFDSIDHIKQGGFQGFVCVSALQGSKCSQVPREPGVYLVLWLGKTRPGFRKQSIGGHFKGRDPTVVAATLENAWTDESPVVYIGKGGAPGSEANLRSRLLQYMQFGKGEPVGHWGGRYVWQLCQSGSLVVCWKTTPDADPASVETRLIKEFRATYGRRPFANLRG